jgi:hypothetical protein
MITNQNIHQQELMDNKPINIGFSLSQITTEQFAIIEDNLVEPSEININMNFRFAADDEKKLVGVFVTFTFESNKKQFIIVEAGCHFSIAPDSWENMMNHETNELKVPKGFLQHMAVITVGTTRGILHAKTENTCFNKYHLPTINVANIIKEDNVFTFKVEA